MQLVSTNQTVFLLRLTLLFFFLLTFEPRWRALEEHSIYLPEHWKMCGGLRGGCISFRSIHSQVLSGWRTGSDDVNENHHCSLSPLLRTASLQCCVSKPRHQWSGAIYGSEEVFVNNFCILYHSNKKERITAKKEKYLPIH